MSTALFLGFCLLSLSSLVLDNDSLGNLHLLLEGKPILYQFLLGFGLLHVDWSRDSRQGIRRDHTPNGSRANAAEHESAFNHYESSEQSATVEQVKFVFHLLPEHDGSTAVILIIIAWLDEVAGADLACVSISCHESPDVGSSWKYQENNVDNEHAVVVLSICSPTTATWAY